MTGKLLLLLMLVLAATLTACGGETTASVSVSTPVLAASRELDHDWAFIFRLLDEDQDGILSFSEVSTRNGPGLSQEVFTRQFSAFTRYATLHGEGCAPGTVIPDVPLFQALDGKRFSLHELLGTTPVLLCFGSRSSEITRRDLLELTNHIDNLSSVRVVMVYIREAPLEGDPASIDRPDRIRDPLTIEGRIELARKLVDELPPPVTVLVDGIADQAARGFGAWPRRIYVADAIGRVLYRGEREESDASSLREVIRHLDEILTSR